MPQSSVIVGALVLGFLVYVTMRGHLATYLQILGLKPGMGSGLLSGGSMGTALAGYNALALASGYGAAPTPAPAIPVLPQTPAVN